MARRDGAALVLPLFCDDLVASCVDMAPSTFGAYVRILCYAWTRGGVPDDESACGRIAGGFGPGDWSAIRARLFVMDSGESAGMLSHRRLELERAVVAELKAKKSAAGKKGMESRWGKPAAGSDNRAITELYHENGDGSAGRLGGAGGGFTESSFPAKNADSDNRAITELYQSDNRTDNKPITPTPTPTPVLGSSLSPRAYAREGATDAGDEFRQRGWAAVEWDAFVAVWNATPRAKPWTPMMPPDRWVDLAASPGWLDRARAALAKLPGCAFFETPVAVTQFFDCLDEILAGQYDTPKRPQRGATPRPDGQMTLDEKQARDKRRAWWRADAGANMTDTQYAAWRKASTNGKAASVAAVAGTEAEAAGEAF